ncbi:MAG: efflux RND transporter permease subunit [Burkholderiaceae bacterium]|nr:efflux RND transporter permease subunit [Burkholderiaceae bacterium]
MWFTRVSIANPVMAVMVMLAFVVLGLFSYQRLKVDQFPDIDFPTVVVVVEYPGASPEIVESEVTRKVEESVNTIAGISQLYSRSYEGSSVVIIQFNLDINGRKAADDVREKLAIVKTGFREEVKEPRVTRFDPSSRPVFTLALTSPDGSRSVQELTTFADQVLKKRLENVRGVGAVTLVGGVKREVNVYLRPQALEAYGVGVDAVMAAVRTENQDLPAGALRSREAERTVQIMGRVRQPDELRQVVVARRNGQPVRLGQVAEVVDGPEELESLALYNGQRVLALDVQKSQGENTIDVVEGLKRVTDTMRAQLPRGMAVEVLRDNARPIRVSVSNVRQTLLEGALLTIGIVFLFLNSWRSTVITGLTLPISLVGTLLVMYAFGFSINMVTLMAMSLCVGLLIDDAIVVRENIVRHVQMGKSAHDAALDGTQEIGLAVLATTLSIVAVFLPIGFMGGIIGKFFHEFGITIVAAVLISMFVSFTLDPMLSSVWHDPAIDREGQPFVPRSWYDHTLGRLTHWVDRVSHHLGDGYVAALGWSLRHKALTLLGAVATLVASLALVPLLGTEFVPKADFSETSVNFYTPVGTPLEVTEARARQVDTILREMPEVRYTVTTINTGTAQGRNYASVFVRLVERRERTRNAEQMSVPLRERLSRVAGITVTHVGLLDPVGGQKPISLSIQGPDIPTLQRLTGELTARLARVPGLVDLDTSMKAPKPTVAVQVRRESASDLGLSVGSITQTLRGLVAGQTVGDWRAPDDQSYDVKVRLAPDERNDPAQLGRLGIATGTQTDGTPRIVRLSQVADVQLSTTASQVNRRDLSREVEITASPSGRALGEVSADIRRVLESTALPPGYTYRFGGSTKDMQESFVYAVSALALGVVFIYMILASQFRSFLQPLALMSSLPLTLIGVVAALLVWRSTLNMFSIIGIVMLMGLVTKNAILLIDFAIRSRADGMNRHDALLHAAKVRLRPILMTTLAMIFGMLPLAFALSEGSEQRAPMGQAVIGGVITSSVLTLVVVPVIYCWLDDLGQWARSLVKPSAAPAPLVAGTPEGASSPK